MKERVLVASAADAARARWARWLDCPAVSSAEEAVAQAAREDGPELIVWDLGSDGELGLGALEALRRLRPGLRLLVVDEPPRPPPRRRSLSLGTLRFLYRPVTRALLRAEVAAHRRRDDDAELCCDPEAMRFELGRLAFEREVIENLPSAATVVDGSGAVLALNAEARRLARRGKAASCRELWGCLVSAERCPLRRAMKTGRPVRRALIRTRRGRFIERVAPFSEPVTGRRCAVIQTGPGEGHLRRLRRLRSEARLDPLTGVLNLRGFSAVARGDGDERRSQPSAFLMLDVDGLKCVNDRFGHAAGDSLLRRLGALLRANTRRADAVGRLGGDEFAVYCPHTSPARARGLVARLKDAVRASNAERPRQPALSVTIGLACSSRAPAPALQRRADRRLYEGKRRVQPEASSSPGRRSIKATRR